VRDLHGHVVWRVRVAPGEMTCLDCGETTSARDSYCVRCAADDQQQQNSGGAGRLVPTLAYLRDGEYERSTS